MAADIGLKCSTFGSCLYSVPSAESAQCGVGYTGYSYIHVEYECLTSEYSFIVDTFNCAYEVLRILTCTRTSNCNVYASVFSGVLGGGPL